MVDKWFWSPTHKALLSHYFLLILLDIFCFFPIDNLWFILIFWINTTNRIYLIKAIKSFRSLTIQWTWLISGEAIGIQSVIFTKALNFCGLHAIHGKIDVFLCKCDVFLGKTLYTTNKLSKLLQMIHLILFLHNLSKISFLHF